MSNRGFSLFLKIQVILHISFLMTITCPDRHIPNHATCFIHFSFNYLLYFFFKEDRIFLLLKSCSLFLCALYSKFFQTGYPWECISFNTVLHITFQQYYTYNKMLQRFLTTNIILFLNQRNRKSRATLPAALMTTSKWPYSFSSHCLLH